MSIHYNAFISYKHADLDNKIAAYVEKHLEHFHIPGKIRKKTGMKKIERIFRDTDELPITSDLSATIEDALTNADYLIVVCSTNTCKSMWVEREINFFLKNHPKENILTVLAAGEPADVVPEILKNKEVTRINENGESVTVIEPVEPLSCDFRLPLRVAKNTEIPRLAAALIGCQYNELMDRQRQYKMKRLTAVFAGIMALSIGFGAYMFNSKQQINESYRASLISQSRYLANESEKLLEDEQRIDALHLALAALPSEEMPDRPVTVEAVRAITQATEAYVPQLTSNIEAEWTYELPSEVVELRIDPEYGNIAAMDDEGNVKVWDKDTRKEIYSYSEGDLNKCANYIAVYNGNLIIICNSSVISIDPRSGKTNWTTGHLESAIECEHPIELTNDDNILIALRTGKFIVISEKDGSVINTYDLSQNVIEDMNNIDISVFRINDMALSNDNTKIAFSYTTNDNNKLLDLNSYTKRLGIYDISSGSTAVYESAFEDIEDMCFSEDGDLFLSILDDPNSLSTIYRNETTLKNSRLTICRISPEDFSVKWAEDFSCSDIIIDSGLIYKEKHNTLSYYAGDTAVVYDASSGEELHNFDLNSSIVYGIDLNEASSVPFFITASGCYTEEGPSFTGDKNDIFLFKHFSDDLCDALVCQGIYTVKKDSNQIIYYGVYVYDKEWESYKDAPVTNGYYTTYLDDNIAAIVNVQDSDVIIDFYDPSNKSFITSAKIKDGYNGPAHTDPQILGVYNDKLIMRHNNYDQGEFSPSGSTIYFIDSKTGNIESNYYDLNAIHDPNATAYKDGKLLYTSIESDNEYVVIHDIESNTNKQYLLPPTPEKRDGRIINRLALNEEQGYLYCASIKTHYNGLNGSNIDPSSLNLTQFTNDIFTNTPEDYIININDTEPKLTPVKLSESWIETEYVEINDSGTRIAATDGQTISICNTEGEILSNISIQHKQMLGFSFYKEPATKRELLIVPYSDGNVCRYDVDTGSLVYRNTFSISSYDTTFRFTEVFYPNLYSTFTFDTEHSCMYLNNLLVTNIFDLNTFTELGCIKNSLGYHGPTDTFLAVSTDSGTDCHLGYFKHYTLKDLIRKAKEILGDHEMPQEQKDSYGI
ncbi:TIR domain-containing protein [Butyrivibrio sp. X503]|uniref:TIR domain-containing protein n=1 Tax=Butyrivibrio sp. X503 TaxID=2364878 RepID=UPI000EA98271|nr:TIR domain-containing protein [Butyrivibrio sp. X503]RKM55872.1 TIR domain-containing protein [Butyrivibrio sp. X503]